MNVHFDLAQIITIVTVIIVIIGWFVNQRLNRKNEILREVSDRRLGMLRSFMNISRFIEEKNMLREPEDANGYGEQNNIMPSTSAWADVYFQIKMYGHKDEVKLYKEIMSEIVTIRCSGEPCITDIQFEKLYGKIQQFELICINSIRKELRLEKMIPSEDENDQ
jgi:hypothetical protein